MLYIFIYTIFILLPVIFFPIKKNKPMSLLLSESGYRLLYLKHEPIEQTKPCELSVVADGHNPAGEQSKPCSQPCQEPSQSP